MSASSGALAAASLEAAALADVRQDLDELLFVVRGARAKLAGLERLLASRRTGVRPTTADEVRAQVRSLASRYAALSTRLLGLARRAVERVADVLAHALGDVAGGARAGARRYASSR